MVYKGGIPNQGFNGTFPSSSNEGGGFTPNAGPAEQKASKGGPATFSGASEDAYLDESGYKAPGEEREGGMKTVDLNDIKSSV